MLLTTRICSWVHECGKGKVGNHKDGENTLIDGDAYSVGQVQVFGTET